MGARNDAVPVESVEVSAYKVPTDAPESDGTLEWDSTTLVLVRLRAAGKTGLGYTYGQAGIGRVIADKLAGLVEGEDALGIGARREGMLGALRNNGRGGMTTMAVAAVELALWDLKARVLDVALADLLPAQREAVPVYGSGGFTSYSIGTLQDHLAGWVESGIPRVKMKVGRRPEEDVQRVRAAREAIGPDAELYVDANGAYSRKQALRKARDFAEYGVSWFEEPVSSNDLEGLRLLRDRVPAGMEITTGEYGYNAYDFRRLLEAGAVDVLQADITRCGGLLGVLHAAMLCEAWNMPFSTHTAPTLHLPVALAIRPLRHMEYFHDHVRIEHMLFDGVPPLRDGRLWPERDRPGFGIELKESDARQYAI